MGNNRKIQIHIVNIDLWSTTRVYKENNTYFDIDVLDDHFILIGEGKLNRV